MESSSQRIAAAFPRIQERHGLKTEMELRTANDTSARPVQPLGERDADAADHVAAASQLARAERFGLAAGGVVAGDRRPGGPAVSVT
jgi:hypothetical protein